MLAPIGLCARKKAFKREAAKEAAKLTGIKKSDIYKSLQSEG